jgi:hypothetical protein
MAHLKGFLRWQVIKTQNNTNKKWINLSKNHKLEAGEYEYILIWPCFITITKAIKRHQI